MRGLWWFWDTIVIYGNGVAGGWSVFCGTGAAVVRLWVVCAVNCVDRSSHLLMVRAAESTGTRARTHRHTPAHTNARMHAHTHAHTPHMHTHTHMKTHKHTRMHASTHTHHHHHLCPMLHMSSAHLLDGAVPSKPPCPSHTITTTRTADGGWFGVLASCSANCLDSAHAAPADSKARRVAVLCKLCGSWPNMAVGLSGLTM